ncbi:MAG: recombinase RecA, partial [Halobacteria archaeon]|nr:recombinase RecA [Halobacteria archaeon]
GMILVTTQSSAGEIREEYEKFTDGSETIRIVDTVSQQRGMNGNEDRDDTLYVSSPSDLTKIGVRFSDWVDQLYDEKGVDGVRVYFESVSPMLINMDVEKVFQFLHVFTRQIKNVDGLGLVVIHSDSHDESEVSKIKQLFDGHIETRNGDNGIEVRVEGIAQPAKHWSAVNSNTN